MVVESGFYYFRIGYELPNCLNGKVNDCANIHRLFTFSLSLPHWHVFLMPPACMRTYTDTHAIWNIDFLFIVLNAIDFQPLRNSIGNQQIKSIFSQRAPHFNKYIDLVAILLNWFRNRKDNVIVAQLSQPYKWKFSKVRAATKYRQF